MVVVAGAAVVWHGSTAHSRTLEPEPGQSAPPLEGLGLSHSRKRTWFPIPQVCVQLSKEPHSPQLPSTGPPPVFFFQTFMKCIGTNIRRHLSSQKIKLSLIRELKIEMTNYCPYCRGTSGSFLIILERPQVPGRTFNNFRASKFVHLHFSTT